MKTPKKAEKRPAIPGTIELGDVARDTITGFEGLVTAHHKYITGCDRISMQSRILGSKGEPQLAQGFDLPYCELLEKAVIKRIPAAAERGGPRDDPQRPFEDGR